MRLKVNKFLHPTPYTLHPALTRDAVKSQGGLGDVQKQLHTEGYVKLRSFGFSGGRWELASATASSQPLVSRLAFIPITAKRANPAIAEGSGTERGDSGLRPKASTWVN